MARWKYKLRGNTLLAVITATTCQPFLLLGYDQGQPDGTLEITGLLTDNIPPYAILSHTWLANEEEVTYGDLIKGHAPLKEAGFRKIQFCWDQAAKDGLDYFWVDTCRIDKSSSSELQEAITSMFKWYRNATKCYVYLVDVSVPNDDSLAAGTHPDGHPHPHPEWEAAFQASRWFTRGWTMQERWLPLSRWPGFGPPLFLSAFSGNTSA